MKPVFLLFVLLLFSTFSHAQGAEAASRDCARFTPVLDAWVEQGMFQGNLLLTKDGEILCSLSVGFADANKQQKILTDSRFPIASLSKPIVASLLLKLQEKGELDLKLTLDQYLPEFPALWKNKVTLHHLLANRSGLPGHYDLPEWDNIRLQQQLSQQAISQHSLIKEIAGLELKFSPGSEYLYTNLGWTLLVEVVERVTGKTFEQNLQEHIFKPLSMQQTGVVMQAKTPMVKGLRWGNLSWDSQGGWQVQQTLNEQVFNGGAGLYSTAPDLETFMSALHQGDWLSANSKALMFACDTPYGWRKETVSLSEQTSKNVHSYDGQLQGHSSFVYYLPEDKISLVMLTNTGMGFVHKKALADDMLRAVYDLPLSESQHSPSLLLHRSLLDNQWQNVIGKLNSRPIDDIHDAILLTDLAQQLDWSGNHLKAIDLYNWLVSSFPDNKGLMAQFERLCAKNVDHDACREIGQPVPEQTTNVGMRVLPIFDLARRAWRSTSPRPVTTHAFYPTRDKNVEPLMLGPKQAPLFDAGDVVVGGKTLEGLRPLILLSHGTGGSAPQMLWLAQALVEEGYVVAAVNHHGNTAFESEKYPEGFLLWWERTQDLHVVRQQLLLDEYWGKRIDEHNIAVVGFSLGGYTALSALGGITDKALFNEYCQQALDDFSCQAQPEFTTVLEAFELVKDEPQVLDSIARQHNSYRLPGLKASVVIAPAVVHAFKPESLKSIKTPTLLMVGSEDKIAPASSNSLYAHSLLLSSQFLSIDNGHHYSFLSLCTEHGKRILPQLCDDPYGITRAEVQQQAIDKVLVFLRENLS